MSRHASLTPSPWASFTLDQQLLMIGTEMQRASKPMAPPDVGRLRRAYDRVLSLTDLTLQIQTDHGLRRESLRWRDLAAPLHLEPTGRPADHAGAFRALLPFTPTTARQIPHVLAGSGPQAAPLVDHR